MNKHLKLVVNNSQLNEKSNYFFEKEELKIILDLYAKMVSNGSWKDYGLKISSKQVAFSVFKNSSENAVYNILMLMFHYVDDVKLLQNTIHYYNFYFVNS